MDKTYKIEISAKTIIFTVFFLLLIKLLWLVRDLLFSLFIAFIIMSATKPVVNALERKKIPRGLALLIVFSMLIMFIGLVIFWIVPPLIFETGALIRTAPSLIENINPALFGYLNINSFSQYLPNLTNQIFVLIKNIFSNAVFLISTIFFSFYFVIEEDFIKKLLIKFFEEKQASQVAEIFNEVEKRMGAWFWGELILMTVVGFFTLIGLSLMGVKYALPLAIIAGILEIVPNLGPIMSAVPSFLVALTQSYFLAFSTIALYFLVQQLENNLIVPLVMKRAVGLSPIITLIALLIGGRIGGFLGILLAIPITVFIETIVMEMIKIKNG